MFDEASPRPEHPELDLSAAISGVAELTPEARDLRSIKDFYPGGLDQLVERLRAGQLEVRGPIEHPGGDR